MNRFFATLSLISSTVATFAQSLQPDIEAVRQQFAPDGRVALFRVADSAGVLRGQTTLPAAKAALLTRLNGRNVAFQDQIQVLPATVLGSDTLAVVNVSVANLRTFPRDAAELATQALLGMPLRVWDKDRGWYLVQTPDRYLAWVDFGGLQRMDNARFATWQARPKLIVTRPYGICYVQPDDKSEPVSDVVAGNVLALRSAHPKNGFYDVEFPDGRVGYVAQADARLYDQWRATARPTQSNVVRTARSLMGIPYLWGGTSVKGMDCSGFTKTVYFLNGQTLQRDASQQVHEGQPVPTESGDFGQLRPGDLLFFGQRATAEKPERVVHVALWLGNGEFIHASGKIRVSSVNPTAPNYDEFEVKRFLRARRVITSETP